MNPGTARCGPGQGDLVAGVASPASDHRHAVLPYARFTKRRDQMNREEVRGLIGFVVALLLALVSLWAYIKLMPI
jgi:hypothetical protein